MSIADAFHKICTEAQQPKAAYVSLYCSAPFYGGPEEGGWWGSDTNLVASQYFDTMEAANAALDAVKELAEELSREAKKQFGEHCLREMQFCDGRGLDYDFFPEPDGEESYFVVVEDVSGSLISEGDRCYS